MKKPKYEVVSFLVKREKNMTTNAMLEYIRRTVNDAQQKETANIILGVGWTEPIIKD